MERGEWERRKEEKRRRMEKGMGGERKEQLIGRVEAPQFTYLATTLLSLRSAVV